MEMTDCHASPVVIVGAGLAGLACAHALEQARVPYRLLESEATPGGLARSITRDGFTFDVAGHWLHLRNPDVRLLLDNLLGSELEEIQRAAWIYFDGGWVPYPFQSNLWALRSEFRDECVQGYLEARALDGMNVNPKDPTDFHDAALRMWGSGITRHFVLPYNEKLWGLPLHELVPDWGERFMPQPDAEEILRGSRVQQVNSGYNSRFLYPRQAGMGLVAQRLCEELRGFVECNCAVTGIHLERREVRLANNKKFRFKQLVSTVQLPQLIQMCEDAPATVREMASGLRSTGVSCVHLAVRGPQQDSVPKCHWVYFPEQEFPFYRVSSTTAAVSALAPSGCRTLSVEFNRNSAAADLPLEELALTGLRKCGLIGSGDDILFTFVQEIPCAYVINDRSCTGRRRHLLTWLESWGVYSIGRYGGWRYGSMEDAILEGQRKAGELLGEGGTALVPADIE